MFYGDNLLESDNWLEKPWSSGVWVGRRAGSWAWVCRYRDAASVSSPIGSRFNPLDPHVHVLVFMQCRIRIGATIARTDVRQKAL